jgi:hypothetical protein
LLRPEITAKSVGGIQDAASLNSWTASGRQHEQQQDSRSDCASEVADQRTEAGAEDGTDHPGEGCGREEPAEVTGRDQEPVLGARQGCGDCDGDQHLRGEREHRPTQQDCS